ncbi:probable serine/threonine-protein kinase kinX isoform X2 [Amyelois transitella]|uniref:probable serine/threonine-protein kinase kinX isoform X2 n=1 Tax=Amyelois transitella TaxID=680683 RepID=UPI00067C39C6|nr:probable serine/threonine-protein kinase kinX isoform X2 [Amyelois transitella]
MKSVYLFIAVFCVVPCAFQDVWDEYDTWYDDFNNLEGDEIAKLDKPQEPQDENVQEEIHNLDENKDVVAANDDYNDYRDYEIEDNRDVDKLRPEEEQDIKQEQDQNESYSDESAIEDFDTLQQIINNDELSDEVIDKILSVDEKSQMDLNDLLPEDVRNDIDEEDNAEAGEGIQPDIEEINKETKQILQKIENVFDNDNGDDTKDVQDESDKEVLPEIEIQADMKSIIDETQQILEETDKEFDENKNEGVVNESDQENVLSKENGDNIDEGLDVEDDVDKQLSEIEANMQGIIDETRQILEDTSNNFDENNDNKDEQKDIAEEPVKDQLDASQDKLNEEEAIVNDNVDSVDKVYEDLNADLDKLLETWKKLSVENNDEESAENVESNNEQALPEEPNADDDIGRDHVEIGDEVKEKNDFDYEGESRILAVRDDYYESILDKDLSDLFKEFEDDYGNVKADQKDDVESEESAPILYVNDALDADHEQNNQEENVELKSADLEDAQIETDPLYGNLEKNNEQINVELKSADVEDAQIETDPLDDNLDDNNEQANVEFKSADLEDSPIETEQRAKIENSVDNPKVEEPDSVAEEKFTKYVAQLTSSELDELSRQFVMIHKEEMKLDADETPIHITLTADEPVVITSPNYPSAYPTDATTIDWILEGLGTGVEVNITDLEINSAMGHYLMLKPGQSDASGDQGIVFAYRINTERRYRFRDVNKLFIRFNPVGGMSFSKGFQLSVRMIEPPVSEDSDQEAVPEPEFLIPEPRETATLLLAGVNTTSFEEIREEFRRLLADMATMYINAKDIDPGMNATIVVTQITRTYVCNVNWPEFDSCVQVTFGIPLIYPDDESKLTESELIDMWTTYFIRDPFAGRLARMGISVYWPPKESYILTIWVVVGVGVLVAAAMLSFALWRYSCVDNYTRMDELGDTDSIHDKKRGLDMYPTPHQTLPPLFTENDYKWADRTFDDDTRVDMGGFTNNTFKRDEMSSESEDDAPPRDRYTTDV